VAPTSTANRTTRADTPGGGPRRAGESPGKR
jgi:hypothetical protein